MRTLAILPRSRVAKRRMTLASIAGLTTVAIVSGVAFIAIPAMAVPRGGVFSISVICVNPAESCVGVSVRLSYPQDRTDWKLEPVQRGQGWSSGQIALRWSSVGLCATVKAEIVAPPAESTTRELCDGEKNWVTLNVSTKNT